MKNITTRIYKYTPSFFLKIYRAIRNKFRKSKNPAFQKIEGIYKNISDSYRRKMGMRFVSLAEMSVFVDEWVKSIDRNFDVVVGVPRSGLLVASMVATKLGKPLATCDNLDFIWVSKRKVVPKLNRYFLVDDSVGSGNAMEKAIKKLEEAGVNHEQIYKGGMIVCKDTKDLVDTYAVSIEFPRFFEWNMLHSKQEIITDLDGVLCEDPSGDNTRNDKEYEKWIKKVKPYLIPVFEIPVILTNRIEKYRKETEKWLKKNNVKYRELIMSQAKTREEQRKLGDEFKIEVLKKRKPVVYWESSHKKAKYINEETSIPVLAVDIMKLVG